MVFKKNHFSELVCGTRDPPLHGENHLKYPFWLFEPLPNVNYRLWQPWLMKRLIKKIDMDSHNLLGLFWNNLLDIHHSILSPSILFNNQRQIIDFCSVLALSLPENESSIIELRIKHSKLVFPGWSWFDLVWFGWWPGWSCTAERWSAPSTSADCAGVHPPQLWGWNLPMAWDSFLHTWVSLCRAGKMAV